MRKIIIAICVLIFLCVTISGIFVFATEYQREIEIEITQNGYIVEQVYLDDVFKVTVIMTGFRNLRTAHPSLHFNQNVVRVSNALGDILPSVSGAGAGFFELGQATQSNYWNGSLRVTSAHPFLRQEHGVIGIILDSPHPQGTGDSLIGSQTVFSVYFKVTGVGNADIRLSHSSDRRDTWDYMPCLYWDDALGNNFYAHYEFGLGNWPNLFLSHVYFTPPVIHAAHHPAIGVYALDGEPVINISQLGGRRQIYATIDREKVGANARLILAVYDNGVFFDFNISGTNQTQPVTLPNNIQNTIIKAFIWEDLINMAPNKFRPLVIR